MNKEQLEYSGVLSKATCHNCGAKKYASTFNLRSDSVVVKYSMLQHLDRISKCCDNPDYLWVRY